MRPSVGRLVLVVVGLAAVAGCGGVPASGSPAGPTAPPDVPGSPTPAPDVPGSPTPAPDVPESPGPSGTQVVGTGLGSIVFTVDSPAAVTVDYPTAGGPTVISTTDTAGATWTLTVPEGALPEPTTLTMAPLASITLTGVPGPLLGGVAIEPSGTSFLKPATLGVTGAPVPNVAIVTGDADGSLHYLGRAGDNADGVRVLHLSPFADYDPNDASWQQGYQDLQEDAQAAAVAARHLIDQPDLDMVPAPALVGGCKDESWSRSDGVAIEKFVSALAEPENSLLEILVAAEQQRADRGESGASVRSLELGLLDRLARKAQRIMQDTAGDPDRGLPVSRYARWVVDNLVLLGGDAGPVQGAIGPWFRKDIDTIVRKIAEDHDYERYLQAWDLVRSASIPGADLDLAAVEARLRAAMTFTAKLQYEASYPRQGWTLAVEDLSLQVEPPGSSSVLPLTFAGAGTGTYADYRTRSGDTMTAGTFPVQARLLDADICAGSARIGVDRFWADTERYTIAKELTQDLPLVKNAWTAMFEDRLGGTEDSSGATAGPLYMFDLEIPDHSASWGPKTFEATAPDSNGKVNGIFLVRLDHAPQP